MVVVSCFVKKTLHSGASDFPKGSRGEGRRGGIFLCVECGFSSS